MENRKLAKQSPYRNSYMSRSTKTNCALAFESALERDYFHLLEFDERVSFFEAQHETTHYQLGEKEARYTPDFFVVRDGVAFVDEVKPFYKTLDPEFQRTVRRFTKLFLDKGFHYRVITEKEIYSGERHHNLRFLHPKLGDAPPHQEFEQLCQALTERQFVVSELQEILPLHGLSPCLVSRAVAHRLMQADLTNHWPSIVARW
jgi:hypothetical protein